jgi:hypothetical protein
MRGTTGRGRQGAAPSASVSGDSVWFGEKDVGLGTPLLRDIDRGLMPSRVGTELVTSALVRHLQAEGRADKELSALLANDLLILGVHDATYEALREVSTRWRIMRPSAPSLSSRSRHAIRDRSVIVHPVAIAGAEAKALPLRSASLQATTECLH